MSNDGGTFSQNLLSLHLQLRTLFDEAGGDSTVGFLDSLAHLSASEQKIALQAFRKVLERVAQGEIRFSTDSEKEAKKMEDSLYADIINAMQEAAHPTRSGKLEVVIGGKRGKPVKTPVDFNKARIARRAMLKPIVN